MTRPGAVAVLQAAVTEDALLRAVTDALTLAKYRWYHPRRSDKALTMGHPGFPDILATNGIRCLALELKREDGRLTEGQREWIEALHLRTVEALVIRPRDLDSFIADVT